MSIENTHEFKAEISELMNIIINAFYSDKDVFLRELISNASDAIHKCESNDSPSIQLKIDSNILIIEDNGIGMDRQDMQNNLGKIAHSGTKAFIESLKQSKQSELIGQFGVGFYSAFLIADIVKVYSYKNDKCYCWECDIRNGKNYKITVSDILTERGTRIKLYIRDKDKTYCNEKKIREIVEKHSLYIVHPIILSTEKEGDTVLNKEKSIWSRTPSDVNKEEYAIFYKNLCNNQNEGYLDVKHFHIEGTFTMKGILYIPLQREVDNPFNITREDKQKRNNVKIYSKNVFIMDRCEDFIPHWLSFIKGVIDSDDIPLNVSREMLQHSSTLKSIETNVIKKAIELFDNIADDDNKMHIFYNNYAKNIKLGINKKNKYSQKLLKYLRYYTNTSGSNYHSLDDYISNMKFGQKNIYFITGNSIEQIIKSPYLEKFNDKGTEVIYMPEPIDECMMQYLKQYRGYNFISICKEKVGIDKIDKKTHKNYQHLCDIIVDILGGKVEKVVLSDRIVQTPACLVAAEKGWSANMERIMTAQALRGGNHIEFNKTKKILEINPHHPIIQNIKDTLENSNKQNIISIVNLIYDLSCFHSGYQLDNAADFSEKMYNMIEIGLGLNQENDEISVL
jgi:molecular chaperone HtpG